MSSLQPRWDGQFTWRQPRPPRSGLMRLLRRLVARRDH